MTQNAYLLPGRLEDVLFLIQYLGLGRNYSLQRDIYPEDITPRSSKDQQWITIAREHPEFFRCTENDSIVLAMRYYLRGDTGTCPPLDIELIQRLIENAIALQERQAKRSEVWKIWSTLIAAVMAAFVGIAQLFVG